MNILLKKYMWYIWDIQGIYIRVKVKGDTCEVVDNTLKLVIVIFIIFFIMCMNSFNKFCLVRNFGTPQAKKWGEIKELMQ